MSEKSSNKDKPKKPKDIPTSANTKTFEHAVISLLKAPPKKKKQSKDNK